MVKPTTGDKLLPEEIELSTDNAGTAEKIGAKSVKDDIDKAKEEKEAAEKKEKEELLEKALARGKELLYSHVGRHMSVMLMGLFFSVCGLVGEMAAPMFIGMVVQAIADKDWGATERLAGVWMIFIAGSAVFTTASSYTFGYVTQALGLAVRQELFEEILKKDVEFFDSRKTGDLISRLEADTVKIEQAAAT